MEIEMTDSAKLLLLVLAFILMWGIAGKCDYDNQREIEQQKIELQEYYGDDYEID